MKKIILLFSAILLHYSFLFAQEEIKYQQYYNERFGFCLQYPSNFKAGLAPTNGDGLVFYEKETGSSISVYGALQMPEETLKTLFEEEQNITVTYATLNEKKGFFVVSGLDNGKIYYQKTVLSDDVFLTVLYQYPMSQKVYFDSIINATAIDFPICKE